MANVTVRFVQNRTTVRFGACWVSSTAFAAHMKAWGASLPEYSSDGEATADGLENNFYKAAASHEAAPKGTIIFLES